ncbi:hypothetical protein O3M35_007293 [Rhynocoris fuscipes]|uniref:Uncharacterized protein n=1 Tax=Rhynocoris fuscipes TaxID=488301 RepID=A0AAW1DBG0_9HEMI
MISCDWSKFHRFVRLINYSHLKKHSPHCHLRIRGQYYTYPDYSELSEKFKREYSEPRGPTCCCHKRRGGALANFNMATDRPLQSKKPRAQARTNT